MDCCSVNGLDRMFSRSLAQRELKHYLAKGLDRRAQQVVTCLKRYEFAGATILEVGFGTGSLHMELIKAGAAKVVGFEASPAYLEAATSLARRLGFEGAVQYYVGDFVELASSAPEADIVVLDRVICCYPDVTSLVTAAAQHTRRLCVVTYPRWAWWIRSLVSLANLALKLRRNLYRAFLHPPAEVAATFSSQSLVPIFQTHSGFGKFWEITIYRRQ